MKSYMMFYFADCGDRVWDEDGLCKLCGGNMHEFNDLRGDYVKTIDHQIEMKRSRNDAKLALIEELINFFSPDGLSIGEENWLIAKAKSIKNELEK